MHNVLERFHKEPPRSRRGRLRPLNRLFEAGWRRSGFRLQRRRAPIPRPRPRGDAPLLGARTGLRVGEPVWLERKFDFKVAGHHVRGRVDRVDRLPDGGYELIDYKTGERKTEQTRAANDLQLALYRLAAREAWDIEAARGSYYYVLDAEKVAAPTKPDDAERVERTVVRSARASSARTSSRDPRRASAAGATTAWSARPPKASRPRAAASFPAVAGSAGTRGRSSRRRGGRRPRRRAARPARPRSVRPALRSPGLAATARPICSS